jgi:hypothetical protein
VFVSGDLMWWSDRKKGICSPCMRSFENLRHEYQLNFELTTFQVIDKRHKFIRLGSWGCNHQPKTPKDIWQSKVEYCIPRLRIATVSMRFASQVGKFYVDEAHEAQKPEGDESSVSNHDDDGSSSSSVSTIQKPSDTDVPIGLMFETIDVPQHDFPLLHSLGINKTYQINKLLQELVKMKCGDDSVIKFTKKNNRPGFLLLAPTLRNSSKYKLEASKGGKFVAAAVEAISQSAQCSEAEAAESLLENLGKRYEESFISVAKKQGLFVPVEKNGCCASRSHAG